eukprot:m.691946 g.691946  ORF g.691946 m.691946 type:complete len:71 (-) comp22857_c0_seq3:2218-2430(-)
MGIYLYHTCQAPRRIKYKEGDEKISFKMTGFATAVTISHPTAKCGAVAAIALLADRVALPSEMLHLSASG